MWKNRCAACNKKIMNPEENYQRRGNWCIRCVGKVESIIKYCHSKGKLKEKRLKRLDKEFKLTEKELDNRCKIGLKLFERLDLSQ